MRMYRRLVAGGVTSICATAALFAFTTAPSATAKSVPTVKIVEAGATPGRFLAYVALYGGMFKKEGVNVSLIEAASGSQSTQLLAGGQVDLELGQLADALSASLAGQPVSMLANLYTRYANSLIVRTDQQSTVKNFSDIAGLPIGITGVGSGTWQLVNIIGAIGKVQTSQLRMVSIGGAEIASGQGLTSGAVDAQVSNDPTDLQLVNSGQAYFLADPMNMTKGAGNQYPAFRQLASEPYVYNTIFGTQSWVKSNSATVQKVMNALQLAADYVHEKPAAAVAALLVKNPEEAPFGKTLLTETVSDAVKVAHSLPTSLSMTTLAYTNTRALAGELNAQDLLVPQYKVADNTYATKALKQIGLKAFAKNKTTSKTKK